MNFVLVGKTASGKTTAEKLLVEKYGYRKLCSHTTRPQRQGEVEGDDYHFVSHKTFEEMMFNDEFIETTEYNGNHYGCSKAEITNGDKPWVVVVDPVGFREFKRLGIEFKSVFFEASNIVRIRRQLSRGDTIEQAMSRLANDRDAFHGMFTECDINFHNDIDGESFIESFFEREFNLISE